jgi:hypothetical protein
MNETSILEVPTLDYRPVIGTLGKAYVVNVDGRSIGAVFRLKGKSWGWTRALRPSQIEAARARATNNGHNQRSTAAGELYGHVLEEVLR